MGRENSMERAFCGKCPVRFFFHISTMGFKEFSSLKPQLGSIRIFNLKKSISKIML